MGLGEVFDEFLLRLSEKTGWHFIPFDRQTDYSAYIDGRTRLEGIHAFLDSRGIRLREESLDDPAQADSAAGLAKRKGEVLSRRLRQRGVTALAGARRYLEAAGHAGLRRAVVSSSTSTLPMLELAGLATLVEERVDAEVILAEGLRSRPARTSCSLPASPGRPPEGGRHLHAQCRRCRRRTFRPESPSLVSATERNERSCRDLAQQRVVPSLSAILDRQLVRPMNNLVELERRAY